MVDKKLVQKHITSSTVASSGDEQEEQGPKTILRKSRPEVKMSQEHQIFIESLEDMRSFGKLKQGKKKISDSSNTFEA